jgi:hypothetical protein
MDHVSQASGLRFELVGTTDSRRFFDSRASWDRGPSVVGWSTEDEYDELDGDVAGVGGSTMVELAGRRRLTTGAVVLDIEVFEELLRTGRDDDAQAIVDHEFGHLVGLDHVDDRGELMHRENTGRTTWGIGDREGLARLGHVPLSGGVLDTVRVSGSDHAVMSAGLATSSSDLLATRAMDRSDR